MNLVRARAGARAREKTSEVESESESESQLVAPCDAWQARVLALGVDARATAAPGVRSSSNNLHKSIT